MEVDELHKKYIKAVRKNQSSHSSRGNIEILSKCGKNYKRNVKSESGPNENFKHALTRYNKDKISGKTSLGPDVMDGLSFENIRIQQKKQSSQITKQYFEETHMTMTG